jgi:hypothetical protein
MKKYNNIIYLTFFFILFNLTFYRDYLYIYRMMLVDFVPYDHYQNQLLFFITEEDESKLTIPAALRLLQILYFYVDIINIRRMDFTIPTRSFHA